MDAVAAAAPEATEAGRSKFFIFKADDDLLTFHLVGSKQARDRDHAIKLHFGNAPPLCVAVSEHAWKPRKPKIEHVIRGLADVEMPDGPPDKPEPGDAAEETPSGLSLVTDPEAEAGS